MPKILITTATPLAAIAIAVSGCSGNSSDSSKDAAKPPAGGSAKTPSAGSANGDTKAACTKVQADLRDAPKAVVPSTSDPKRTLQAARELADRLDADVHGSKDAELQSAVGQVAQVFRDIATAGAGGDTSGIVQSLSKIGESGRRIAEICARAGVTG